MTAITAVLLAVVALAFAFWLNTPSGKRWNRML